MVTKGIMLFAATSTCLLSASGCGVQASSAKSKTLVIWTFVQDYQQLYDELAPSFEKMHPGVKIDVELLDYNSEEQKYTIVRTSNGVNAPDIIDVEQGMFPNFMRGDVPFVPLNSDMKKSGLLHAESPGRQALYTVNGNIYGVEHAACVSALYYRKDLYAKAGIDVSKLKTWNQFVQASKKLTGPNRYIFPSGQTGDTTQEGEFEMLLRQAGGDVVTKDGQIGLDTPKAVKVLQMMRSWQQQGIEDKDSPTGLQFWNGFKTGRYIAAFGPDWWAFELAAQVPSLKGKWGAVPMPKGAPGWATTTDSGGTGTMISKYSSNKQLAWEFIKYALLTPSSVVKQYEIDQNFPSLLTSLNQPKLYANNQFAKFFGKTNGKTIAELYKSLVPGEPAQNQAWWRVYVGDAWGKYEFQYESGQLTAAQFLAKVKNALQQDIDQEQMKS
jgi:ABC-type glycerol-3-phosphate transport system substrate-binding protein